MSIKQIKIEFPTIEDFETEFQKNLTHGGTFVRGTTGFEVDDRCETCFIHPQSKTTLLLPARVVWVVETGEDVGTGIALDDFGSSIRERLKKFFEPKKANRQPINIQQRLRNIPPAQQIKVAKEGELPERVALERIYGKSVWEPLLRNPRLTPPEVAKIAKMGSLPRPQIEQILSNPSWLRDSQVRRALLGNPRLGRDMVNKILKMAPKSELNIMVKQTAYSPAVREAARRILDR